ncbi:MAG TPA: hypothetical protein VLH86_02750 [Patescibacteria group bacterium]|nr:hypothetical protein [Patescibacteria group bacterium]
MNITLIEGLPHAKGPRAAEIFLPGEEKELALRGLFAVAHGEWPDVMGVDEAQHLYRGVVAIEAAARHNYPGLLMRDRGQATDVVASAIVGSGLLAGNTHIQRMPYDQFLAAARTPLEGIPAEVLYVDLATDGTTPLPPSAHSFDLLRGALVVPDGSLLAA